MKHKKLFLLFILLFTIFVTACGQKDTLENSVSGATDYPDYFLLLEEQWGKDGKQNFPLLEKPARPLSRYTDSGTDMEAMSYMVEGTSSETEYRFTKIKLNAERMIEDVTIALGQYGEAKSWFVDNVYYNEGTDKLSILFNRSPEGAASAAQGTPFLLLAQLKADEPQNYSITAYVHENAEELWFSGSVVFKNQLYENLGIGLWQNNIWSVDLNTKELLCLKEETAKIREMLEDYFVSAQIKKEDGGSLTCHVAYVKDDVIVYRGMLWYDNAETPFAVYLAYRGREYLGTMVLDNKTGKAEIMLQQ